MSNNYIPNNEHFLKRARNIRNELLNRTDRYFLIDYPISYDQQIIIKAYRQELRDFINNNKPIFSCIYNGHDSRLANTRIKHFIQFKLY